MRKALGNVQRKLSLHLWMDRLVFRGDGMNIDDRILADIGLARRGRPRPVDPIYFI